MKPILLLFLFLLLCSLYSSAQQVISSLSEIKYDIYHDVSPPLREMKILASGDKKARWENGEVPNQLNYFEWSELNQGLVKSNEIDPVLQDQMGILGPINTIANFEGIAGDGGYTPPDPNGAAGADYYIQTVNCEFAVYSKMGDSVYGPAPLATLWQGFPGYHGSDGDPIVLYDHLANRWLVSQFSLPNYPNGPCYELVAISQSEDPMGSWNRYSFQFTHIPDYPKFGIWPDGYYMSVNTFSSGSTNWMGPLAAVLERDSMLVGGTARMIIFQQAASLSHMLPASLDGPAPPLGTPGYFMLFRDNSVSDDKLKIFELHVDWDSTANSSYKEAVILNAAEFAAACQGSGCIPQKDVSQKLDAMGKSMMNRLQYRNFGGYQSLLTNHIVRADGPNHTGVRWYEIRKTDGEWSVFQQSTYAPDTLCRWNASAAMDGEGNIALGYSISGKAIYPSIGITGRRAGDVPNHMTCIEEMIVSGTGAQSGTDRWGDYSSLNIDPTDDHTFWYTNMYYTTTSQWTWNTRVASFTINDLQVNVKENPFIQAKKNHLRDNFPNPFSQKTTIRWTLTDQSAVKIQILDLTGKAVANLVDADQNAGEHSFEFDSSGLPAGIYFCHFIAGQTIETQKLILIK